MQKKLSNSMDQRKKIFEAAASVMISKGSLNITMDDIASRLKGTKGTLYYYFKSKGELLYAMQMHAYDLTKSAVYYTLKDNSHLPARERLELFLKNHCIVFFENWPLLRALWTDIALYEAPPELKKLINRRRRKYETILQALIEETAKAEGLACREPRISTKMALGLINNVPRWYRNKRGGLSPEEMADLAVQRVLYGLFDKNVPGPGR